jgi:hypothetical protein
MNQLSQTQSPNARVVLTPTIAPKNVANTFNSQNGFQIRNAMAKTAVAGTQTYISLAVFLSVPNSWGHRVSVYPFLGLDFWILDF